MEIKPYQRKPHFYETDQMGIIHHANYIHWFEEARVDFMEQMGYGYNKATQAGVDFAVLGVSCRYKKMVRFNDVVEIAVSIVRLTASRMTVRYLVVDQTGDLCAEGESEHCYFQREKQRPVALPKVLPELYALFQSCVVTSVED